MRETTECRVEELIERSRAAVRKRYGTEEAGVKAVMDQVVALFGAVRGLDLAERVAVFTCGLDAALELYADEVDGGNSSKPA